MANLGQISERQKVFRSLEGEILERKLGKFYSLTGWFKNKAKWTRSNLKVWIKLWLSLTGIFWVLWPNCLWSFFIVFKLRFKIRLDTNSCRIVNRVLFGIIGNFILKEAVQVMQRCWTDLKRIEDLGFFKSVSFHSLVLVFCPCFVFL